jgi:trans-aconitate 2-methyltransferase
MLETAAKRDENIEWQQADIAQWEADNPVDILFSNAALQWIPEHAKLFPRLTRFLRPGGLLAIQVPNNFLAPSHQLIGEAGIEWRDAVAGATQQIRIMRPGDYFDVLSIDCDAIDLWQTQYCHVLHGEDPFSTGHHRPPCARFLPPCPMMMRAPHFVKNTKPA